MSTFAPRRVLVCGSRSWTSVKIIEDAIKRYVDWASPDPITIIHGGASGADTIAGEVARRLGVKEEVYWADWYTYGASAGPRRNQKMVEAQPEICLAFPMSDSRGTWDMINRCKNAGINVICF